MVGTGVGSKLFAPWRHSTMNPCSFITWNARALCHHRHGLRRKKLRFLEQLLRNSSGSECVIAIQEVHGTPAKIERMLYPLLRRFQNFSSFTPSDSTPSGYKEDEGSVLTLVPRKDALDDGHFSYTDPIPGRVLRVSFTRGTFNWFHWNVHNHGLTLEQVSLVRDLIQADMS
jgi:hypothetical protein